MREVAIGSVQESVSDEYVGGKKMVGMMEELKMRLYLLVQLDEQEVDV